MESGSKLPKERDGALPSLTAAIDTLGLARDTTVTKPAKDAFVSAGVLLTTIRVGLLLAHAGCQLTLPGFGGKRGGLY